MPESLKIGTLGENMEYQTKYQSIVLMGKITSGKSSQAEKIINAFGGIPYSNGDKIRAAAKLPTGFGLRMKETYEKGYLMPEWIASYWMTHALVGEHEQDKIVFEAVAKKPHEAETFHEIHTWLDRSYIVFNLEVSDDVVRDRSQLRLRDTTDFPKSVEKRLNEYYTYTSKSIEIFRDKGTLVDIDGTLSREEVQKQIFNHLSNK